MFICLTTGRNKDHDRWQPFEHGAEQDEER
jgi:hypothetical protein